MIAHPFIIFDSMPGCISGVTSLVSRVITPVTHLKGYLWGRSLWGRDIMCRLVCCLTRTDCGI